MRDGLIIFGIITCIVVGLFAFVLGIVAPVAYGACASQSSKMGFDYSWGPLQDCMIKVDGQWILLDSYKTARVQR